MCGLAGAITKSGQPVAPGILTALTEALHHRGPDGNGTFQDGPVALVHTRLAIIDPGHGLQPFVDPDGLVLVANGEIYNDPAIRSALPGAHYQTGSDNESALHLYKRYGLDFTKHMRGMYAVALYDPKAQHIVLARDPFGIKPLYLLETPDAVWFASEPQALIKAGLITPQVDCQAVSQLLGLQYSCGSNTAFSGIRRVEPGAVLTVSLEGGIEHVRTDSWHSEAGDSKTSETEFDRLWLEAVDLHRRSDVPYGIFLSSGTDSAAVLAAMARLEERPVVAFTAGFSGTAVHDERQQAAAVAAAAGADHHAIEISADMFWQNLPRIALALDDPVADYAAVPTYFLAQKAAEQVKVVLTGEGGDEIFAGYGRYRAGLRPWPFRKAPWSRHILDRSRVLRQGPADWRDDITAEELRLVRLDVSPLQRLQALDIDFWLPNDLLTKVDRCLMAHGIEGRVPFLDRPFASFGFDLSDSAKISGRLGKMPVRRWLDTNFPEAQPFARKKGFSVPVGDWIAAQGPQLAPLVAEQQGISSICDPDAVRALFRNFSPAAALPVWVLLFYAVWHQVHIHRADATGSVFDVLAERTAA